MSSTLLCNVLKIKVSKNIETAPINPNAIPNTLLTVINHHIFCIKKEPSRKRSKALETLINEKVTDDLKLSIVVNLSCVLIYWKCIYSHFQSTADLSFIKNRLISSFASDSSFSRWSIHFSTSRISRPNCFACSL